MTELMWEEPPTTGRGRKSLVTADMREQLMDKQGEWAKIETTNKAYGASSTWRKGKVGFTPVGAWEFVEHKSEQGTINVYVRYVGSRGNTRAVGE